MFDNRYRDSEGNEFVVTKIIKSEDGMSDKYIMKGQVGEIEIDESDLQFYTPIIDFKEIEDLRFSGKGVDTYIEEGDYRGREMTGEEVDYISWKHSGFIHEYRMDLI